MQKVLNILYLHSKELENSMAKQSTLDFDLSFFARHTEEASVADIRQNLWKVNNKKKGTYLNWTALPNAAIAKGKQSVLHTCIWYTMIFDKYNFF